MVVLLGAHLYYPLESGRNPRTQAFGAAAPPAVAAAVFHPADRPIYPYSVIRGGAYDAGELDRALQSDPLVRTHYAVFSLNNLRFMKLAYARGAYVSYRMDGVIYWTRRPVQLTQGEVVLTDGSHLARARCGNRISDTPEQPTSSREPAATVLETPESPDRSPTAEQFPYGSASFAHAPVFFSPDLIAGGGSGGLAPGSAAALLPLGSSGPGLGGVSPVRQVASQPTATSPPVASTPSGPATPSTGEVDFPLPYYSVYTAWQPSTWTFGIPPASEFTYPPLAWSLPIYPVTPPAVPSGGTLVYYPSGPGLTPTGPGSPDLPPPPQTPIESYDNPSPPPDVPTVPSIPPTTAAPEPSFGWPILAAASVLVTIRLRHDPGSPHCP